MRTSDAIDQLSAASRLRRQRFGRRSRIRTIPRSTASMPTLAPCSRQRADRWQYGLSVVQMPEHSDDALPP